MTFEDQTGFVTDRFDRVRVGRELLRVPMEDFCQALGVPPERKYQNMGGPGPRDMLALLAAELANPAELRNLLHDARVQCSVRGHRR